MGQDLGNIAAGELREPLLQGLYHVRVVGIRSQIGGHSHLHRPRRAMMDELARRGIAGFFA